MSKVINLNKKWCIRQDVHANGRNKKYWFENIETGKTALFKYPTKLKDGKVLKDYVTEALASKIAEFIGLSCAKVDIAEFQGELGSLSYNFLSENEILVDGTVLLERFSNYAKTKMKYSFSEILKSLKIFSLNTKEDNYTFKQIPYSIDNVLECLKEFDLDQDFVNMIFYDALIGNKDRNQSNFGLVINEQTGTYGLAPLYDNGSSLGIDKVKTVLRIMKNIQSNEYMDKIKKQKTLDKKISNITHNAPSKIQLPTNNNVNHYNILNYVINKYPERSRKIASIINTQITQEKLENMLSNISNNILSNEEKTIIIKVLLSRKKKICELYEKFEKEKANRKEKVDNKEYDRVCTAFI